MNNSNWTLVTAFIIFITFNNALLSQSSLTLDAGTTMGVLTGTDLCANIINGSGIIYGSGTICGGLVAIEPVSQNEIPNSFAMSQNYPNPFNPVTTILYQLPVFSNARIVLYDILGQETALLFEGLQPAGYYRLQFDASHLASGIYIYKIEAGNFVKSMKMSVVK